MRTFPRTVISQEITKKSNLIDTYTVPTGKTLNIIEFSGGHEYSTKEVRIELLVNENILAVGYGTFQFKLRKEVFSGQTVKTKLVNQDSDNLHMTGIWEGILIG